LRHSSRIPRGNQEIERRKMGKRLFVGSLSWNTDGNGLRAAFERFGTVEDAKVIEDRETGRSRGFGFVTFTEESAAQTAIEEMNGAELDGRTLAVNEAQERAPRGGGFGRGGGGRGGGPGGRGGRGGGGSQRRGDRSDRW
jgi:cold-inducible RNA-binding protein